MRAVMVVERSLSGYALYKWQVVLTNGQLLCESAYGFNTVLGLRHHCIRMEKSGGKFGAALGELANALASVKEPA